MTGDPPRPSLLGAMAALTASVLLAGCADAPRRADAAPGSPSTAGPLVPGIDIPLDERHLLSAAARGDTVGMRRALAAGVSPDATDASGRTALHHAVQAGSVEGAVLLIDAGAEVDAAAEGIGGSRPIHVAAGALGPASPAIVRLLLGRGVSPDTRNARRGTALMVASERGSIPCIEALLAAGADPDAADDRGGSPLHFAVRHGHPDAAHTLLAGGASPDRCDEQGWSALHYAAAGDAHRSAELLLAAGAEPDLRSNDGLTPLHRAASRGSLLALDALLTGGADPDAGDPEVLPPLIFAIDRGQGEVVERLIAAGADLDRVDPLEGRTALHHAVVKEDRASLEHLLAAGARPDARDRHGVTPLCLAAHLARTELVALLLARGADPEIADELSRYRPLHWAAFHGDELMTQALLRSGADAAAVDRDGSTAALIAANAGRLEVLRALIAAGADPRQRNSQGFAPIHLAAGGGFVETVRFLLDEADVPLELVTAPGPPFRALHFACHRGHADVVRLLLERGSDPGGDEESPAKSPLELARESGSAAVVRMVEGALRGRGE